MKQQNKKIKFKKGPKALLTFFLIIFILQMLSVIFLLLSPEISQASDAFEFKPQVGIGTFKAGKGVPVSPYLLGNYIKEIYKYLIGIIGIVASAVIMFSGFQWIMAAGSQQKITEARDWISAAIGGLALALLSWLILNTINPATLKIARIEPLVVTGEGCCHPEKGQTIATLKGEFECLSPSVPVSKGQECLDTTAVAVKAVYKPLTCSWQITALVSICRGGSAAQLDSSCSGTKPVSGITESVKCCCKIKDYD